MAAKAPPIGHPRDYSAGDPRSIASEELFMQLLSLASSSTASALEIMVHDPLRDFSADWMRVPQAFRDSFEKTPFTHVRELTFRFSTPPAISLLYDLLPFMPALRSLEVMAHITSENERSSPDMPEFSYPAPPVVRLERLIYGTGLALRTLVEHIISPSATTLSAVDLYWHRSPKSSPALPRLPNVRSVMTIGCGHQAMHLIRQCPRLSHLKILTMVREDLGGVVKALDESGARIRALEILPCMVDLNVEDEERLVRAIPGIQSLWSLSILARDVQDPFQLRQICRERRICLR